MDEPPAARLTFEVKLRAPRFICELRIAGRKDLVARIAKNPMKRALRLDKIRLAALDATLKLYRDPDRLPENLPTLRAFVRTVEDLSPLAERLVPIIAKAVGEDYRVKPALCESQIGSGALPLETLKGAGVVISPVAKKAAGRCLEALVSAFRSLPVPVIGRVTEGALLLDLRCLEDVDAFISQLPHLAIADGGADA